MFSNVSLMTNIFRKKITYRDKLTCCLRSKSFYVSLRLSYSIIYDAKCYSWKPGIRNLKQKDIRNNWTDNKMYVYWNLEKWLLMYQSIFLILIFQKHRDCMFFLQFLKSLIWDYKIRNIMIFQIPTLGSVLCLEFLNAPCVLEMS